MQKSGLAVLLLLYVAVADMRIARAQEQHLTTPPVAVRSAVKINPPSGGWYPWYQVAADPTDPNRLIVCGSKWDAKDNALYGFVFSSLDGGQSLAHGTRGQKQQLGERAVLRLWGKRQSILRFGSLEGHRRVPASRSRHN